MATRTRTPNFTTDEKMSLLNIISDFKNIIECKKSDTVTWKDKEAAWIKITNKFNCTSPNLVKRSKQSLQKFYENKKREVRKTVANDRLELLKTGGGKPILSPTDPTENLVLDIINKKSVIGLDNNFDGDHASVLDNLRTSAVVNSSQPVLNFDQSCDEMSAVMIDFEESPITLHTSNEHVITDSTKMGEENNNSMPGTSNPVDWGNYKGTHLKTPISKKLKCASGKRSENWVDRRRPTQALHSSHLSEQYSDLASVKLELALLQKEAFIADTKTRQKREEIEFDLKKQSLELDIALKKQQLKKLINNP